MRASACWMPDLEVACLAALLIELHQRVDFGGAHRAAIRASRQRRQDRARAGRFIGRRLAGRQMKIRRRLGVSPTPVALNGPVIDERSARRPGRERGVDAEVRVDLVDARAALAIEQRRADRVRSGRDLQAEAARVLDLDLLAVERDVDAGARTAGPRPPSANSYSASSGNVC